MIMEPLLIIPHDSDLTEWYHPDIEKITDEFERTEYHENIVGNLMRFHVEFNDGKSLDVITVLNDYPFETFLQDKSLIMDRFSILGLMLSAELWAPVDHLFVKTEYGKSFVKEFDLLQNMETFWVSPDVSLATDGELWWFDS